LKVIEREQLLLVLGEVAGNKAKAAEVLGISRRALYRRLEKHGLAGAIQRRDVMPGIIAGMLAHSAT
jgi:DNA-binding NtrC family response regulator